MRVTGRAIAVLCVFGVAASALAADRGLTGRKYVEDEVIVRFKPGVIVENVHAMVGTTVPGAFVVKSMALPTRAGAVQLGLLRAPRGQSTVEELVAQFSASPDVEYAEPNYVASIPGERATAATAERRPARAFNPPGGTTSGREISGEELVAMGMYPTDSYYQWGFGMVGADVIWMNTAASPLVAVIDSGVDYTHPDLVGKVLKGYNFVEGTADPMDDNGHGTHVAGVIAARPNNKVGIAGISNGSVLAIKALDFSGHGTYFEIAQAIYYAANNAAVRVINMSLGGPTGSTTLRDAVGYAVVTKGKLLVASAGNDNVDIPPYPAGYSVDPAFLNRVLAVAAEGVRLTISGSGSTTLLLNCKAPYTNYGTWVNVMAPGTEIISTMPTRPNWNRIYNYGAMSGTSMAAPFVAGVTARVWSVNPLFTNVQIAERLTGGGTSPQPVWVAPANGPLDIDQDGTPEIGYCWDPAWATKGGTSGRTLPSLAQASASFGMQRGETIAYIYDAANGNALPPGTVLQVYQGAALKGQSTMTSLGQQYAFVSNLPWSTTPYTLKVSKSGYTSGAQAFGTINLNPGWVYDGYYTDLAIPRLSANRTFVTNWPSSGDVDQHLLLPPDKPFDVGTDFGPSKTRLASSGEFGSGTLAAHPYARYVADSHYTYYGSHEATAVRALYPTTAGPYRLFNRDYSSGDDLSYGLRHGSYGYSPVGPVTRLWQGGAIKATVSADTAAVQTWPPCTFNGGTAVCDKWYVGDLDSAGVFTPVNTIGDGVNGAVLPYGGANLKAGIAAAPKP
jgi:subtilisin family serine protease